MVCLVFRVQIEAGCCCSTSTRCFDTWCALFSGFRETRDVAAVLPPYVLIHSVPCFQGSERCGKLLQYFHQKFWYIVCLVFRVQRDTGCCCSTSRCSDRWCVLFSGFRETRNVAAVLPPDGSSEGNGGEAVRDGRAGGRKEVLVVRAPPGDAEPAGGSC